MTFEKRAPGGSSYRDSTLLYDWLRECARWSESCVLIGYPSGQDGPILPAREFPLCSRKSEFFFGVIFWPYNESFINQACSITHMHRPGHCAFNVN